MKKIISFILAVLIIASACLLPSCKKDDENKDPETPITEEKKDRYVTGRFMYATAYKDTVIFTLEFTYNYIEDPLDYALPIFNTTVAGKNDDPFEGANGYKIIFDEKETDENDGIPVIYVCCKNEIRVSGRWVEAYPILKFNMATGIVTSVVEDVGHSTVQFAKYGDRLYYEVNTDDGGRNIYSVKTDGSDMRMLENPNNELFRMETIADGRLYFTSLFGTLYSCDCKDLSDVKYLRKVSSYEVTVCSWNGDIYYAKAKHTVKVQGDEKLTVGAYDIYRAPADDPENEELFIKDVTRANMFGERYLYYTAANSIILGEDLVDVGWGVLYEYNADTKETREVYNMMGKKYHSKFPVFVTDEYIIFKCRDERVHEYNYYYTAMSIATGEEKRISTEMRK